MKRRIGKPQAPKGPQYVFFELMQRHVLNQGDKSLATLSKESGWSRQTWHKALRGPELPNRDLVKALVEHLFPEQGGADIRRRMVEESLVAWTAAVAERTFGMRTDQSESPLDTPAARLPVAEGAKPVVTASGAEGQVRPSDAPAVPPELEASLFRWNPRKKRWNLPEEVRFFELLRDYYVSAGQPPVRWIAERMPKEAPVTRSTLSEWLNGTGLPSYSERLQKALEVMRQYRPVTDREVELAAAQQDRIGEALTHAWHARPH
ncbi:hypothetical protein [Streptomyces sp. V4I2]|uniref:hypothetical protein n=1 Tax=Streptomyces sp. V4I2 TaxID=3042280 RepID=UPI002788999C|nr:hypothetical protein [Streptomyces sp. V4I2]MDQ1047378.1 hypothetical protein [Streptomyces sp. V4I2]